MKISMELVLVGMVTAVACVVSLAVMFEQLWPVVLIVVVGRMVYRHYYPKYGVPRRRPWQDR